MSGLKILCLHGYRGSASLMREQSRYLATACPANVDFTYLNAPSIDGGDHGWWHAKESQDDKQYIEDPGVSGNRKVYQGWDKTKQKIIEVFRNDGPFDGIMGFSQGAALTALLVGLRASDGHADGEFPLLFKFAIMIGGFPSNDPKLAMLYDNRKSYTLPSLHIVGKTDSIVTPATSRLLAAKFEAPVIVEHPAGHVIPSSAAVTEKFKDFLKQFA